MTTEIVHVVPGHSAAGTIRHAVAKLALREKVVALGDHLGYGPIAGDLAARRKWLDDVMGPGAGDVVDFTEAAWKEVFQPHVFPVIWTCRSSAEDFSSLLDFLSRADGRPFQCIDVTGAKVQGRANQWVVPALGVVSSQQMIAAGFLQNRSPFISASGGG